MLSICWTIFVVAALSDAIIVSNGQRQRQTFYLLDQAWKEEEEEEKLAIMLSKIAITLSKESRRRPNDDNK